MALTLLELMDRMEREYDELTIMEKLGISTWDLLRAFTDRVEENYEELSLELEDEQEE